MGSPDPPGASAAVKVGASQGLGIVRDDQVILLLQQVGVAGGVGQVDLLLVIGDRALGALQGVVYRLGDREEVLISCNDLPVAGDTQVPHQGYLGTQYLCHAAPVGSGVQVQDPSPSQGLGQ